MSGGVLRYTVVVRHPDTAEATALVAGSEVPEWASGLVQADDLDGAEKPAKKAAAKQPSTKK